MSALAFTDAPHRLRRIVENAIGGATFAASRAEDEGRALVLDVRRADGRQVTLRFLGVQDSQSSETPVEGSIMRLRSVGVVSPLGLLGILLPKRKALKAGLRVKIDCGAARLEVVCQDADWWEEAAPA